MNRQLQALEDAQPIKIQLFNFLPWFHVMYYSLFGFSPLLGIFYFIVIPIWLIIVTKRVNQARREIEDLRMGKKLSEPLPEKSRPHGETMQPRILTPGGEPPPITARPESPKGTPEKQAAVPSFEERIGAHWFQWLGIAALIAALIFFLKWAFDNGWIGPVGRTVIGYVLAGGAMVAGDKLRKKYGVWSLAFTGGGALAAYIVTWIAFHKYNLLPSTVAIGIYSLTTLVTCLLAGYYRSIPLAAFGIIGGFLTPLLTGEGGSMTGLLTYILIIDLGVLALGHVRQWRALNALAFIGTVLWEYYAFEIGHIERTHALLFMAAFGGIYLLVPAMYNILRGLKSELGDLLILIGNGLFHFGMLLWWLERTTNLREQIDAPVALAFSALFLVVSAGIYQKNRNDTPLVLAGLSLTVLFATIAIPLQIGEAWTSLAWSVEASFLLWMSLQLKDKRIQLFAWPVMGAAYFWYLFIPNENGIIALQLFGFWLCLFFAALLVGIASVALQSKAEESNSFLPFALLGVVVLVLALSMNILESGESSLSLLERFFEAAAIIGGSYVVLLQAKLKWSTLSLNEKKGFTILGIGVQIITLAYLTSEYLMAIDEKRLFQTVEKPWQIKQVGTSILWAVYASIALTVGFLQSWKSLRLFSIVLLLIAIGKLTLIDLPSLGTGYRVLGFTVLGALLVGASFLYQRNKAKLKEFFVSTSSDSSS